MNAWVSGVDRLGGSSPAGVSQSGNLLEISAMPEHGDAANRPRTEHTGMPDSGDLQPPSADTPASAAAPTAGRRRCPAAWGENPTPLLPRWHREALADQAVPPELSAAAPGVAAVGDLARFWDNGQARVTGEALKSLIGLANADRRPPDGLIVVPSDAGIDGETIEEWPLRTRTRYALLRSRVLEGPEPVSVGRLLQIYNFGTTALIEFMCMSEAFIEPQPGSNPNAAKANTREENDLTGLGFLLEPVLAAAPAIYGIENTDQTAATVLASITPCLKDKESIKSLTFAGAAYGSPLDDGICSQLDDIRQKATTVTRTIIEKRFVRDKPESLRSLGSQTGVTGEGTRKRAERLQRLIESNTGAAVDMIAGCMRHVMGPVTPADAFSEWIERIFDDFGYGEKVTGLARWLLDEKLDYTIIKGFACDRDAVQIVKTLKKEARRLTDDAGLIDEYALLGCLPDDRWGEHIFELFECCSFYRFWGCLSINNTLQAKLKAALVDIGRPATKKEILAVAGPECSKAFYQFLDHVPSIVRTGKTRWGIAEWGHDVYERIPAEMTKMILEDGGAVSAARLMTELPSKFEVKASSVSSYIHSFQFHLEDGMVSLADPSSISFQDFDDVIDGRTDDWDPYWVFKALSIYYEGYSLIGVPPAIAVALGCEPGGKTWVPVARPVGCKSLSVVWNLSAVNKKASIGCLSGALKKLGASPGNSVRLVIKQDQRAVEFRLETSGRTGVRAAGADYPTSGKERT